MDRRRFLRNGIAVAASPILPGAARASDPAQDAIYRQDFDELWTTLGTRYCFFADKTTDWARVRALYRPMASNAGSPAAFTDIVRRVLAELYDAHTHLSNPPAGTPRWPLYDLMVERDGNEVRVAAVEEGSVAFDAGVVIGDVVVAIDGRPIEDAVRDLMPRCLAAPDPQADVYALNVAVAGRKGEPRTLSLQRTGKGLRTVDLPLKPWIEKPQLEWRRLDGNVGYIAIRSFADPRIAEDFDKALLSLRDTRGLLLDVRYNGGGDTAVAKPIMGRFIGAPMPYATMRRRDGADLGPRWTERVEPRGPFTYTAPVVVLTNHWSASMAEGFPMGMRGIGRATVVGTPMMGLGAAVFPLRLDRTGLEAQYSAEPVYDIEGRPRWLLRPDIEVAAGKDILDAGLAALAAKR